MQDRMNAPKLKLVTSENWRQLVATRVKNTPAPEVAVGYKFDSCGVERVSDDEIRSFLKTLTEEEREAIKQSGGDPEKTDRILVWTISTEQRDRDHDRIMVNGWDLRNYRKNPVVLFGHNYRELPVGKSVRVWKDLEGHPRLRAIALFTPKELGGGFGYSVYELAKNGFLPASSVGFRPGKWKKDEDDEAGRGYVFEKDHELLEWSPVPVPSNPGALQEARGLGIDLGPYATELEKLLDGETSALWLPKDKAEELRKSIRPEDTTVVVSDPEPAEPETKADPKVDDLPETETDEQMAKRVMTLLAKRPQILDLMAAALPVETPQPSQDPTKSKDPTPPAPKAKPKMRDPYEGTPYAGDDQDEHEGKHSGGSDEGGTVDVIMRAAVSLSVTFERDVALIDQQLKTLAELKQSAIESLMKARDLIDAKIAALSEKDAPKPEAEPDGDPVADDYITLNFEPAEAEPDAPETKEDEPGGFEVDLGALFGSEARG